MKGKWKRIELNSSKGVSGAKQGARVKRVTEGWDEVVVVVAAEKECRGRNHSRTDETQQTRSVRRIPGRSRKCLKSVMRVDTRFEVATGRTRLSGWSVVLSLSHFAKVTVHRVPEWFFMQVLWGWIVTGKGPDFTYCCNNEKVMLVMVVCSANVLCVFRMEPALHLKRNSQRCLDVRILRRKANKRTQHSPVKTLPRLSCSRPPRRDRKLSHVRPPLCVAETYGMHPEVGLVYSPERDDAYNRTQQTR